MNIKCTYQPAEQRYDQMRYQRCGHSGVLLPAISLGLWHNFGDVDNFDVARDIVRTAFDLGITHFDLANNYGPPYGAAEANFGRMMHTDLSPYRDELFISTKAGYDMWPGPYGNWGSRKYLISSLDQSLKRMRLEYVDLFYSHRPDPATPIEETMGALDSIVRQGKALYVGLSNYNAEQTLQAIQILRSLGTPCLIHQARYSMLDRWVENGLLDVLAREQVGCIAFSPLAQGMLTNKYLHGIPEGSRASKTFSYLKSSAITEQQIHRITHLNDMAIKRGQTLAQMALAWVLRTPAMTSVLIGASSVAQLNDNIQALKVSEFSEQELKEIDQLLKA